jgi:hypothetical protein
MLKSPLRLLEVHVSNHGTGFEWRLSHKDEWIMSGLSASRPEAQKEGDSALFAVLLCRLVSGSVRSLNLEAISGARLRGAQCTADLS